MRRLMLAMGVLVAGLLCGVRPAAAQTVAATIGGGERGSGVGATRGWKFTVGASPISVTHLGLFDYDGDGFDASHPVAIWRVSDQMMVTSAMLMSASPISNNFRFEAVSPTTLSANTSYVIGALMNVSSADPYLYDVGIDMAPGVTYDEGRASIGDTLQYAASGDGPGRSFGPNFRFSPTSEPAAVPEPGALALFLPALGLVAVLRRRRA